MRTSSQRYGVYLVLLKSVIFIAFIFVESSYLLFYSFFLVHIGNVKKIIKLKAYLKAWYCTGIFIEALMKILSVFNMKISFVSSSVKRDTLGF